MPRQIGCHWDWWFSICLAWLFRTTLGCWLSEGGEVSNMQEEYLYCLDLHRQVNMNYSFVNTLTYNMDNISSVISFYNINCSYMKKLWAQLRDNRLIWPPSNLVIVPDIGMWHMHGHQSSCFAWYSPLFIPGAGWVNGEIIETLWSNLNIVSGSAWGMTSPHQQELLDFQMNDSNFIKMIKMYMFFYGCLPKYPGCTHLYQLKLLPRSSRLHGNPWNQQGRHSMTSKQELSRFKDSSGWSRSRGLWRDDSVIYQQWIYSRCSYTKVCWNIDHVTTELRPLLVHFWV